MLFDCDLYDLQLALRTIHFLVVVLFLGFFFGRSFSGLIIVVVIVVGVV